MEVDHSVTVEEEHGILTYSGMMFLPPHFHFKYKSVNIFTILVSKLKHVWKFQTWFFTITWDIYFLSGI